ncbi:NAD(P)-dependent oxidoreductase [Shouchella hunanensis]|uniref:NAD(P)-dependent oxidoreductase n=1 Tax=Shouchella hunanensis TaxID=766894 RepID=A0ABY7W6W2_9BACI|nr:NAD(P)-dependent oxidoreductase [Shouchella hunanensis]WDF04687.1 NAD(P)-dependent oxidoreductase [Shouchella hunanensis]
MTHIFISGEIPVSGYEALKKYSVDVYECENVIREEDLIEGVRDATALLCPLSTKVTRKVMESAPSLKIIANYGAGFDNIDLVAAKEREIVVTNTPKVSTDATAELTLGLMLSLMRRIPEGDQLCRTEGFNGWAPLFFLGRELKGKTLGIVGYGKIGQAVAKRAQAFGMNILYTARTKKDTENEINYRPFDQLIQEADIVSIHTAYSDETHHLFNEKTFKRMKKSAILLNVSRGPVVHEEALVRALKQRELAGAALDVFENEPLIHDELKTLANVVLTPHIGNATIETREEMARLAAGNITSYIEEGTALTPVG